MGKNNLFDNTQTAFSLKSDSELERAYFLFKMIANEPLVRIGTAVTNFAIKAHLPVQGLIRATVFDHFCGGVSEEDCLPVVDKMYTKKVCSVLDYSVEGKEEEKQFDAVLNKTLELIEFADQKDAMPFGVFKPTGFGRFLIWQKKTEGAVLTQEEQDEWERIEERFDKVCQKAYDCDVALLIDGEESWMQDAADDLVAKMMRKYNKDKAIVYNTLQLYRHDRQEYLQRLHEESKVYDFKIGVKIVRGAYMEKENERAKEKGYPTPICKDKNHTDQNFNMTMKYILENIEDISVFIGTHNEESSYLAMQLMEEYEITKNDPRVWFGQLYGMSDHISFNQASEGYNVAKYLPFGPVRDVMPYLIRRAEENTSVAGQTSRELNLLSQEKKRRKL
ncbi:proline dehydrogenase family protein [Aquimarina mytili]|uniref:Proline dehydrogenase family protein n=1 Tax=Aquimarina mytili TaxID=874423 RepID=A0A937DA11_9FLAO|nr:proline dehydrogenase family protein [Aquimarina mytili]MBL0683083.1 proline dehydrogenase family protein [Aquimarina mytili]